MSRLEMVSEIAALDAESAGILAGIGGDVMNKHWKRMKLIDVIQKTETINPQKNPDASFEYIDVSSICNKQFRIQETSTILGKDAPSRARKFVRTGDILFATVRPTLKRIAQVPEYLDSQVCSTGYFVLRPKDFVEARFLFYFLFTKHFMGAMEQLQKGASYPAVNDSEVSCQTISIPPLSEQKRIVSIVDEAFEAIDIAIDNTKQNLTNAHELFDSYLNAIFTQKGDEWEDRKLGTLINVLTDYHANGSYEKLKQNVTLLEEDSYAYMVRSTDFENNFTNSLKYIDRHAYEFLSKSKVFADDIIISKIGNAGKVYLMPTIDRPCSLAMNLFLLRTDKEKIRSDYLYFFLESQFGRIQIAERLNGTATKTIRKDAVRSLNIFVAPLIQQKNIVEKLDMIIFETQRLEAIYRQKLAALNELKQSILHKAFTGELTTDKADLKTNIEPEAIAV